MVNPTSSSGSVQGSVNRTNLFKTRPAATTPIMAQQAAESTGTPTSFEVEVLDIPKLGPMGKAKLALAGLLGLMGGSLVAVQSCTTAPQPVSPPAQVQTAPADAPPAQPKAPLPPAP
jgi:hypothetical protein